MYGANQSLFQYLKHMDRSLYNIFMVLPDKGDFYNKCLDIEITVLVDEVPLWITPKFNLKKQWNQRLKQIIRLKLAKRRLKKQITSSVNRLHKIYKILSIDLIYSNSSVFSVGLLLANALGCKHIWHFREMITGHFNYSFIYSKFYVKNLISKSSEVFCVSQSVKNEYLYFLNNQGIVLPDPIFKRNEILEKGKASKSNHSDKKVFACIGLIHKNKGQEDAIRSFATFIQVQPYAELLIIGSGNAEPLKELCRELNVVNKVIFTGFIDNLATWYTKINYVLVTSINEGLGRVALEAMAHKVPVIARYSGGSKEIIIDKQTGIFYDIEDRNLTDTMHLLCNDNELKNLIVEGAFQYVLNNFSTENAVNILNKAVEKTIN